MMSSTTADTSQHSPVLNMAKLAALLHTQGRDVGDLTLRESDFNAPLHVFEAAQAALDGRLTYSPSSRIKPLRQVIHLRGKNTRHLDYADEKMAVGCGATHIICNAFQPTLKSGDEVIIPTPFDKASALAVLESGVEGCERLVQKIKASA